MKRADLPRAARLGRAIEDWDAFDMAFNIERKEGRETGVLISVGYIETDCGGELVQPDHDIVVDAEIGKQIVAFARNLIDDELKKLGAAS